MKVYIIATPEFSKEKLDEIVALLQSVPGEINFKKGEPLTQPQFNLINPKLDNISQLASLTFAEFFDLIKGYRVMKDKIAESDFVILISSIRNSRNWFSAFKGKNIFIHGDEWDIVSQVDSKFGIAHQCVENIFQSAINLSIENVQSQPNIHMKATGCINDFCEHKPDILIKLQSATICHSCFQRAQDEGLTSLTLVHIISIMEEIRTAFVISRNFISQTKLDKVIIDEEGKIMVGDKMIKLEILPKTMYINFLKHIEGIPTNKLCENRGQFDEIYELLKTNPDEYAIRKMCCNKIQYRGRPPEKIKPTFETYRSKIKRAFREKFGEALSTLYAINLTTDQNNQNRFKVPLSKDQFEIHPKFSK